MEYVPEVAGLLSVVFVVWRMLTYYEKRNADAHAELGKRIDAVAADMGKRIDAVAAGRERRRRRREVHARSSRHAVGQPEAVALSADFPARPGDRFGTRPEACPGPPFDRAVIVCYNRQQSCLSHFGFLRAVLHVPRRQAGGCRRRWRRWRFWPGAVCPAMAQDASSGAVLPDGGIPVTSDLVHRVCGTCHRADEQRRMSRISYQRTTPEGWQQTIRRMVLLNNLQIEPADAREAVRYLATNHGLAPEEARLGAFEVERRNIDFHYEADPETQQTCNRCHSMGRVLNQRRTLEEWELLTAMHRGYYPLADVQSFLVGDWLGGPGPEADDDDDGRTAVERAVAHLAEAFPLDAPEWASWSANMRTPRLEGTWVLVGNERGQGPVYGEVVVEANPAAPDELETRARYTYPAREVDVTRTGQALVYTGYQWRGRSTSPGHFSAREVMFVSRDRNEMTGRWFTGAYDERGIDVTLRRVGPEPMITGVYPSAVPITVGETTLRLFGANLPDGIDAASIDLGAGLTVTGVGDQSSTGGDAAGDRGARRAGRQPGSVRRPRRADRGGHRVRRDPPAGGDPGHRARARRRRGVPEAVRALRGARLARRSRRRVGDGR